MTPVELRDNLVKLIEDIGIGSQDARVMGACIAVAVEELEKWMYEGKFTPSVIPVSHEKTEIAIPVTSRPPGSKSSDLWEKDVDVSAVPVPVGVESPVCPYCGKVSKFCDSKVVYGTTYGMAYVCSGWPSCDSYISATDSGIPKGTMANKELRTLRRKSHKVFDAWWKKEKISRDKAYAKLAVFMGLRPSEAHIGRLDVSQCEKVIKEFEKRQD